MAISGNFFNQPQTFQSFNQPPVAFNPQPQGIFAPPQQPPLLQFLQQMLGALSQMMGQWQGINMPLQQVAQLPVRDDIRESIHRQMAVSGQRQHPPTQQEVAQFEQQFEFIPGRQRYPDGFGWTKVENGVLYSSQGVPIGKVRPEFAHKFAPQQPTPYQPPVAYNPTPYQPPVAYNPTPYQPPVAPPPVAHNPGGGGYK